MLAFHNTPVSKSKLVAQLEAHAAADEIVKGIYWEGGKGCAVGCTVHSRDHSLYESRFGIPQMLAHLEDAIFEGLPNGEAKAWPLRFINAIQPGQDLSLVGWQFLYWLLTDETVNPGISHPLVRDVVRQCADVVYPLTRGRVAESAESAAWSASASARSAAESAAWSAAAESAAAESAAAESAAAAAWSASAAAKSTWAAASAESAARSASASAARSASASAARWAAWSASWAAEWFKMADKLISLIEMTPVEI